MDRIVRHEGEELPADPELEGPLGKSVEGVETMAKLLGTMRRNLRAEGFSQKEAYALCETWLVETFGKLKEEDDEDEE